MSWIRHLQGAIPAGPFVDVEDVSPSWWIEAHGQHNQDRVEEGREAPGHLALCLEAEDGQWPPFDAAAGSSSSYQTSRVVEGVEVGRQIYLADALYPDDQSSKTR
jgi:hypothetical protein